MPMVQFEFADGKREMIEIESGLSVMEGALRGGIEGIDADCGGACACGTCRVIVAAAWRAATGEAGDDEITMLELAPRSEEGERLSCQIVISEALDGLVVTVPEEQYR